MKTKNKGYGLLTLGFFSLMVGSISASAISLDKLHIEDGFKIEIYAEGVKNARQMAMGDKGTVFVGSRDAGLVHALVDVDGDFKVDKVIEIASGLNMPSGLAFRDGNLYVGEVHQVIKFVNIESHLQNVIKPEVVINDLPSDRHHGWKYIDFGPDGWLYVPVGAPCNICEPSDNHGRIFKYNLKSGEKKSVAQGVRNSVGFDWDPKSGDLWFSDNGRDMMGDDIPPCEINHVSEANQHFGYPYIHGGYILDPEFGKGKKASDYRAPAIKIQAHSAPLGIHFYEGKMFPNLKNKLLIAEHGSWNRSKKVGYRVTVATIENGKVVDYRPFISGWLQANEKVIGRPVAFLALNDGSFLISDDSSNVIYRISSTQ